MIIIGGGSAGLYLAIKRAEHNIKNNVKEKIIVVEEHKSLGLPVQCTGILTNEIYSLLNKKDVNRFVINRIKKTKIFSPNNSVELKLKENLIIDNKKFTEFLEAKAETLGVKIFTRHRYFSNEGNKIKIKDLTNNRIKIFRDNFLVGADGPLSKVASCNNMCSEKKYLLGIQARIKTSKKNKNIIDFYPGVGAYAWSVPEGNGSNSDRVPEGNGSNSDRVPEGNGSNSDRVPENENISRIGVAVPIEKQNIKNKIFEDFLKKYPGEKIEIQSGLIPLFAPRKKILKMNGKGKEKFSVALVGDAALQIKNTTGGGIIPGMKAAEALSSGPENYKKNLRKLNKELYLHYLLHEALFKYTDSDWDRLVEKVKNKKIRGLLEETNRDNFRKIALSLLLKKRMFAEGIRIGMKLVNN